MKKKKPDGEYGQLQPVIIFVALNDEDMQTNSWIYYHFLEIGFIHAAFVTDEILLSGIP